MTLTRSELWPRFQKYYSEFPALGLALDISRIPFPDDYLESMKAPLARAFIAMAELEKGGIANPDEKRMVGHYWLRNPDLAPTATIRDEIRDTVRAINEFAEAVHSGAICGAGGRFTHCLLIGIGGSALGPRFVNRALSNPGSDKIRTLYFDNTDPDGMDQTLAELGGDLGTTICLVISKSGSTPETRNGMLEAQRAYAKAGLEFNQHAVAITGRLSDLDKLAAAESWVARFPMWDWVGGRTSQMSAVGLVPAALQGIAIQEFLDGARACDDQTRIADFQQNPAAQLALMWHFAGNGRGDKNMVILPYKDRLELFSRYLRQLVMESLGKERDLQGRVVNQGLTVFGNKGSTDQHAFVQQLRDGRNDFFLTFIEVLQDRQGRSEELAGWTAGEYLLGFLLGTREALWDKGRISITLTLSDISERSLGCLIALYERAVGLYASLIGINAYHQPGVEAGKKAATSILALETKIIAYVRDKRGHALTSAQIASGIGAHDEFEFVFKLCEHLAANPDRGIRKNRGVSPFSATYEDVS